MTDAEAGLVKQSSVSIIENVAKREDFHDGREQALQSPELARDRLAEYAKLNLKILKAQSLTAMDPGWFRVWDKQKGTSDPYTLIFVDDIYKEETKVVNHNLNPTWDFETVLDIETAGSIVQLQVMDKDLTTSDDMLGFVEFPVADLPLGQTVKGWLSLTPKQFLQSTAPQRLEKALLGLDLDGTVKDGTRPHNDNCGAVFVEMTLNTVSADQSDEFYAYCLPKPTFKIYPRKGYQRPHEPLDAQGLLNEIELIKASVLDGFLLPCYGCMVYIFTWRESWLTFVLCWVNVIMCFSPFFTLAGIFANIGILLLVLKNPQRRMLMSTNPKTVSLDLYGYDLVAKLNSSEKMTVFLERVVASMHGKVLDRQQLRDFAAFSLDNGKPVTSYIDLKRQLRDIGLVKDSKKRFVSFPTKPLPKGTLVARCGFTAGTYGEEGEISECTNPNEGKPGDWKYKVALGDGPKPEYQEIVGEELETQLDLRWLSNPVVLKLIPDGVEDMFMTIEAPLGDISKRCSDLANQAHGIVAWETKTSLIITIACFVLCLFFSWFAMHGGSVVGLIIAWILKIAAVLSVIAVFSLFSEWMVTHRTKVTADLEMKKHEAKDPSTWPFFKAE